MSSDAFEAFRKHLLHPRALSQYWPSWVTAAGAVILIGAAGLIFDSLTPQIISVGIFYVMLVLMGFWFSNPKSALVLALLATALTIVGYWIAIPDNSPMWEAWTNRALAIGSAWMAAVFVWHTRVLEQKLQTQIEITNDLSREMEHRVGNHLQFVAAFLRLQAKAIGNEQSCQALELASSRVVTIGNIHRMLSHSMMSHKINSKAFITAVIGELRSNLPDPERHSITVHADPAQLTSTQAVALGALILELINNAVKHAFPNDMKGMVTISFAALDRRYIVEVKDDGVGTDREQNQRGFGTRSVADLARLMGGSVTCQAARQSDERPGTMWRVVIPA